MRSTFAQLDRFKFRLRTASVLLGISENTLRGYLRDSGIEIKHEVSTNPGIPQIRQFSIDNLFQLADWRRQNRLAKTSAVMPTIITISSTKLGAGKSTTAAELSIQLQLSGRRVLMIDLDFEGKLTQYMGYEPDIELDEATEIGLSPTAIVRGTFFDVCKPYLTDKKPGNFKENFAKYIKWPFGAYGPALVPSDTFLGNFERAAAARKDWTKLIFPTVLQDSSKGKVPGLRITDFDVVIFDCPSSRSFIVSNALAVADYVVVPIKLDSFAKKGIEQMVSEVSLSRCKSGRALELIFLPTHCSDISPKSVRMWRRLHHYKHSLAEISISYTKLFTVAQEEYVPLTIKLPKSLPAMEYRNFSKNLLERFSRRKTAKSNLHKRI